jgi:hypothetical protein
MTAAREASPEGWQVSVSLVCGSWVSVFRAGYLVGRAGGLGAPGRRARWLGASRSMGRCGGVGWGELVLGDLVVAALAVLFVVVMTVEGLDGGWSWRASWGTGLVWRD